MARIVMKFGGTSVADINRIRNVARHVKREVDAGHEVAVVVSAMAGKTNELVAWTREASPHARCARIRHRGRVRRAGDRRAAADRAAGDGHRCALLAGLADPDPHRQFAWRGADPEIDGSDADRRGWRGPGGGRSPGSRGSARTTGSRRSGAADPIPARWRSPRRQGRSLRHLHRRRRGLYHRPAHRAEGAAARRRSRSRRCWKWRRSAPRCCRCARSSSPWCTACGPSSALPSTTPMRRHGGSRQPARNAHLRRGRDRGKAGRHRHRLFQGRGPDHRSAAWPTGPAWPLASSARSPKPTSMST